MFLQHEFTRGWQSAAHGAAVAASPLGLRSIAVATGLERASIEAPHHGVASGALPVRTVRINADSPDGGPVSFETGPSPFRTRTM
jgi:hypothetical protein